MTVPARLSLVTLGVRDVTRATAFYEALGWKRSSASVEGDVTFLHMAGTALGLWSWDRLADDAGVPADGEGFRGVTLACIVDSPEAVDAAAAAWVAAGGTLVRGAQKVFWGGYTCYVADPDGYLWELAHNPYFPIREDGTVELPA
jgi:catechol 2,3-dioxygenase-like lactoylglutathione lyase family enzyme